VAWRGKHQFAQGPNIPITWSLLKYLWSETLTRMKVFCFFFPLGRFQYVGLLMIHVVALELLWGHLFSKVLLL